MIVRTIARLIMVAEASAVAAFGLACIAYGLWLVWLLAT